MDGSKATVLVKGNLEDPEFLTIDLQKEILYFSSSHKPKIESCNLDGTNRYLLDFYFFEESISSENKIVKVIIKGKEWKI